MIVVGGGGGFGFIVLMVLGLFALGLGAVIFYCTRILQFRRRGGPQPRFGVWQWLLMVCPFVLITLFLALLWWAKHQGEQLDQFEAEKDKNRYFTLTEATPFGGITLPAGTHLSKHIPRGFKYNAARDLNDVDGIRFPHPVYINGMSVIEISPTTGFLQLAEDYVYLQGAKQISCAKTHYVSVALNNYDLYWPYVENRQPRPPSTLQPDRWVLNDCSIKINEASSFPYWENGILIRD